MGIRNLDPDDDYAFDRTNQSAYPPSRFRRGAQLKAKEPMAIYVSDSGGGNFTPHPTGLFQMTCADVIDNGICETKWGPKHKITLRFQSEELTESGERMTVSHRCTASLNEKAELRKLLEAWRGRAFTPEELRKFDLENLIGVNAMVNVIHRVDANGKTWANIASLAPLMRNLTKLTVSPDYVRQKDRTAAPTPEVVHADSIPF